MAYFHSVPTALETGGLRRRLALITTFLFLLHNPTSYSLWEYIQRPGAALSLRISLGLVAMVILIALIRQTWTGVRPLGGIAVTSLLLAITSLIWFLWDWVDLNATTRYLTHLAVFSIMLTFGQVVSYYVRQFSGQRAILREPP